MKKVVKILIFIAVSTFVSTNLFGTHKKDTTLIKQVQITKSYAPKIGSSIKKDISPEKVTHLRINAPIFDYSIAYKPQDYDTRINTLESIDISSTEKNEGIKNGFAKIAIGYPYQSIADLYYNANPNDNIFIAGGLNHKGFWNNLQNDMGSTVGAMDTQNSIFGMFEYKKDQFMFNSNIKYSNQIYTPYGIFIPVKPSDYKFNINRSIYNIFDFDFKLGTPFNVDNSFNWMMYSDVNYFNDNSKFNEVLFTIGLDIGMSMNQGKHFLGLNLEYKLHAPKNVWGNNQSPNTSVNNDIFNPYNFLAKNNSHYITVRPNYLRTGDISTLDINLGIITKISNGKGHVEAVLPNIKYTIFTDKISAYTGIRSDSKYMTHNNLIKENPYLLSGITADMVTNGDLFLGIEGTISSWFSWTVEGGGRFQFNVPYFVNILDGNTFTVDYEKSDVLVPFWFVNTNVSALIMNKLIFSMSYKYQSLELYTYAKHNFTVDVKYEFIENWTINLSGNLLSKRDFIGIYNSPLIDDNIISQTKTQVVSVPTKFYLSIGLEYIINNTISVTADLNNIMNSKSYQFNHYPEQGINGMIGITIKF